MHEPLGRWERWGVLGLFVITCLLTVGGIISVLTNRPERATFEIIPPQPTGTAAPTATLPPIVVYITGEVVTANQVVTLPVGSRISDAVDAAGGFTTEADVSKVNLATLLQDGQQIHIPALGEVVIAPTASSDQETPVITGGLLDVNSATVEQLSQLPGIGPALAQRIIDYREQNGLFKSLDDLDLVSGIGPSIISNIRDMVTFGGF